MTRAYFASGDTFFVDLGARAHTVMGEVGAFDVSRLESDNLARWDIAGRLNVANALADRVLDHPRWHLVRHLIRSADRSAAAAQRRLASWDHHAAARAAHRAYGSLVATAEQLGICATT